MICPQTKAECKAKYCQRRNVCWDEKFPTPPKPTMAEFERLVLALRQSSYDLGEYVENNASEQLVSETRKIDEQNYAALIGWVRPLLEKP